MIIKHSLIPNYVSASTPRGLRRLMLMRAAKKGRLFKFTSITYVESEKKWYAWYVDEVNDYELLAEAEEDENEEELKDA